MHFLRSGQENAPGSTRNLSRAEFLLIRDHFLGIFYALGRKTRPAAPGTCPERKYGTPEASALHSVNTPHTQNQKRTVPLRGDPLFLGYEMLSAGTFYQPPAVLLQVS